MTRIVWFLAPLVALTLPLAGCDAERNEAGDIAVAGGVSVFLMRVGDCFDDHDDGEVQRVGGKPCAEPHDNEVYALFDLDDGPWPGEDAVEEAAGRGCLDRFQTAIGLAYEQSVLEFYPIKPTEGSWNERGDREVVCVAYHMELTKLTGSVLRSGM